MFLAAGAERFGLENVRPLEDVRIVLNLIVPLAWCAAACAAVVLLSRTTSHTGAAALATVCIAVQAAFFKYPSWPNAEARRSDVEFVKAYLSRHSSELPAHPTIYVDWANTEDIWLDMHANSYLHLNQTIGVMFSRATSMEVIRRAMYVAPFERWRYRTPSRSRNVMGVSVKRLFGDIRPTQPAAAALTRLCSDPVIDLAVLDGPPLARAAASDERSSSTIAARHASRATQLARSTRTGHNPLKLP